MCRAVWRRDRSARRGASTLTVSREPGGSGLKSALENMPQFVPGASLDGENASCFAIGEAYTSHVGRLSAATGEDGSTVKEEAPRLAAQQLDGAGERVAFEPEKAFGGGMDQMMRIALTIRPAASPSRRKE